MARIRFSSNSFLKQNPSVSVTSGLVGSGNAIEVLAGVELGVTKVAPPDEYNHQKITLAVPIDGKTTWYAFQPHLIIWLGEPPASTKMKIRIKQQTYLKQNPSVVIGSPPSDPLPAGVVWAAQNVEREVTDLVELVSTNKHRKIKFAQPISDGGADKFTWYIYAEHMVLAP